MLRNIYYHVRKMPLLHLIGVLAAAFAVRALVPNAISQCRAIPGDASWPCQADWNSLNKTVSGRLIATIPIAASCHTSLFNEPNPTFDRTKCDALRNVWFLPETHLPSSSSPMSYPFGNNSCNPFSAPETPCTIGHHVSYTINATSASDFQKAVSFAKKHNIRLVIRNTGHDYLGRSTGAHSLAIWTHYMKEISLVKQYQDPHYSGPAIKMSAGVEAHEAYAFADAHKLMVVGGNCPTVGIAGGYTQGGGHGPLASKFGLAADQVLEWQVVTAAGDLITASPKKNSDLFWALRGGGGSTFGVVASMTVKAFPDTYASTANFQLFSTDNTTDAIYDVLRVFLLTLPGIVDSGVMASWIAAPFGFLLMPAFAPDLHKAELDALLKPTIDKMKELNLDYQYNSGEHPTFLSAYSSLSGTWNVSDYNLGGRLIPRSLVENDVDSLVEAIRYISAKTLVSGVSYNVKHGVSNPDEVGANPYFRQSIFSLALGTPINYTDWSVTKNGQNQITNDFLPRLAEITPRGGAYLNEADFQAHDFKALFYGTHYDRLYKIKAKYDPTDIFYARTAVGSDRWTQGLDGRLCRTSNH
jgi:FAD/FMN-containing dehydrogenase